jgi:DNA-binding MarR family transcriptional regulator
LQRQSLEHSTAIPNEHIGLLIAAARRRIKQAVGDRARRYSLTAPQFWVLVAIRETRGTSLRELAARLRMDEPTASRVVTALIQRKLVRTEEHPTDRRRSCLHLATAGVAVANELHETATEIRNAVAEGLTAAEKDALRVGLRKVIANMDRLRRAPSPEIEARRPGVRRG